MDEKSHMKIWIILLAVFFIVIAAAGVYAATSGQKNNSANETDLGTIMINWYFPEYNQLIAKSDLIVVANVTDERGVWDTADGKKPENISNYENETGKKATISTEYTFKTNEILKGTVNDTFLGRVKGGTADGYTFAAMKVPSFDKGDIVLLFIQYPKDENGNIIPMDYIQIGEPDAFIQTSDGNFSNDYYGEISLDQLKKDIAATPAA
ncbi:hypothetical protein [Methanolapillus ohkumae]|uniref:Uncharacterized protein n=1 Tax=Methanolapillus ohkumae TaxID=3028298 RepID=A0AA96V7P6_9EURY|nr:hypothetical protein MsAm2_14930 [Methanosarcinaceae archaeon Am2]